MTQNSPISMPGSCENPCPGCPFTDQFASLAAKVNDGLDQDAEIIRSHQDTEAIRQRILLVVATLDVAGKGGEVEETLEGFDPYVPNHEVAGYARAANGRIEGGVDRLVHISRAMLTAESYCSRPRTLHLGRLAFSVCTSKVVPFRNKFGLSKL